MNKSILKLVIIVIKIRTRNREKKVVIKGKPKRDGKENIIKNPEKPDINSGRTSFALYSHFYFLACQFGNEYTWYAFTFFFGHPKYFQFGLINISFGRKSFGAIGNFSLIVIDIN